jgi:hypothetical protein
MVIPWEQVGLSVGLSVFIIVCVSIYVYKKIVPYLMRQTLKGYMSGFARNQKAVKGKIVGTMLDKSLVGPALDMLGLSELKNYLRRHPDATFTIMQYFAPFIEQLATGLQNKTQDGVIIPSQDSDFKSKFNKLMAEIQKPEVT